MRFLAGLASLFRFEGRLGRRDFAAGALLVFLLTLGLGLLAERMFGLTPTEDEEFGLFRQPLPNALIMLFFYWIVLALSARRVRDIGAPVIPVVVGLAAIELLEWLVLPRLLEPRLPAPFSSMTLPGGLLSLAALLWLLLWPGRSGATDSTADAPRSRS